MSYRVVKFINESQHVEAFLALPKNLYARNRITQNEQEERDLLCSKHILSKYFKLHKFLVYQGVKPVGRATLTIYPNDNTAYIGFFECIDNLKCAATLLGAVEKFTKSQHINCILGPVDASFWIKYRLKIDCFESRPYTNEPYNQPYYQKLFEANGYTVSLNYLSNFYSRLPNLAEAKKLFQRYHQFSHRHYQIKSPSPKDFDQTVGIIYDLLMVTYQDFPVFKPINKTDFAAYFGGYQRILDFSMMKVAYLAGKPVGFFIGLPDYGNQTARKNWLSRNRLKLRRIRARRYVMLYLGVLPEHRGLGLALVKSFVMTAFWRGSSYIGALIAQDKVTAEWGKSAVIKQYHYVLLEKKL